MFNFKKNDSLKSADGKPEQHTFEGKRLSLTERGSAKSDVIVNDLVWL